MALALAAGANEPGDGAGEDEEERGLYEIDRLGAERGLGREQEVVAGDGGEGGGEEPWPASAEPGGNRHSGIEQKEDVAPGKGEGEPQCDGGANGDDGDGVVQEAGGARSANGIGGALSERIVRPRGAHAGAL